MVRQNQPGPRVRYERGTDKVGYGGRIELAFPELEAGQTVEVHIVTQSKPKRARPVFGRLKGLITIHDNFDDPIPGLVR